MKDVLEPFSDIGAPATACWCACFNFEDSSRSCDEHKAALVAEVRRLRAEVVTLECERAPQELVDHLAAERDAAHAEAERLRGELDAAEGAMADIAGERAEAVAEAGRVREALQAAEGKLEALREHTLDSNPALRTLHNNAVAYLDAVEALSEVRDGAPLSTTLGWMIRQRLLVPVEGGAHDG